MTLTIRAAREDDLSAITAIYDDAVTHGTSSYELTPPDLAEMRGRFEVLKAGGYPYLVAEMEGDVAGYAYAGAFRPRPAYRFIVEDSVYVSPRHKAQGVGRALMEALIAEASRLGFRQIIAVIGDGHPESASVKLHAKVGFTDAGKLVGTGYKHGRWLDTAFMQLALNEGADAPPDPASLPERRFRGQS